MGPFVVFSGSCLFVVRELDEFDGWKFGWEEWIGGRVASW